MTLEERVARLESELPLVREREREPFRLSPKAFLFSLFLSGGTVALAYRGLGLPNHPYQTALGILTVALAYHRGWFRFPTHAYQWLLAPLNAAILAMLFKLLIGSGIRQPFHWLKYPSLEIQKTAGKWFDVIPDWSVLWQPTPLATWQLDFTVIQTFLLLITLVGALFRFQPFVSFTAFFLILVSLPAFTEFDWVWIFPAIASAAIAFYAQSAEARQAFTPSRR